MKTLFQNCSVLLRKNGKYFELKNSYVGVNDNHIDYIGEKKPATSYDVVKDMSNKLLMPGLINAHGHTPMVLLRGVGSNQNLQDWLTKSIFPVEDKLRPFDMMVGSELGIMEMLASGTTCFSNMYFIPYTTCDAVARSGIKANTCLPGICFDPSLEAKDWVRYNKIERLCNALIYQDESDPEIEVQLGSEKLPDYIKKACKNGLLRVDLSLHSDYLTTPNFVKGTMEHLNKYRVTIQAHASETEHEVNECIKKNGMTPIQYMDSYGTFDLHNAYLAHCVHATDDDLKIMKEKDVSLVYNPASNMKLASGVAPIPKALKMGINVALGTDGCASNNNLDMFKEMYVGALIATGFNKDPSAITVDNIIDMATINGAKALGRDDTGILEVGKKADIIAIDLTSPHLKPNLDAASLIVYSADGSDVCMTMVEGKILYEDGKFLTLDKEDIYKRLEESINYLYK